AIAKARAVLDAARVPVTVQEAIGAAAEEIARAADELHCDGIVMGHRGLGVLKSLVMGSVSEQVVRLAKVPVTLVK
ncbi:MAG TPA: universal stress protein, partial [Usitatibacter sp.]